MSNQTDADKAKKAAEETARKDAEAKERADAKAKSESDAKAAAAKKAAEETAKRAEPVPTPAAPYPTQADLDAMRDGTFRHGREVKADDKSVGYKTR